MPEQVERRPRTGRRRNGAASGAEISALMRDRLIESRLTPNAISLTGFVLNVVAAVLVWQRYFFLAGVAFIVGSIMDTLDGRYSRMSGKGTPFGAFLDSTLDRMEEGIVLTAVAAYFAARGDDHEAGGFLAIERLAQGSEGLSSHGKDETSLNLARGNKYGQKIRHNPRKKRRAAIHAL